MKNQDLKSGLFGSIGENMVAFELAKRNWYIYRPYFDTRIDFIAQKFICKTCFGDWESKHIVTCSNNSCTKSGVDLNQNDFIKNRKCRETNCLYLFPKYTQILNCPSCNQKMKIVTSQGSSNQRNFKFICKNNNCSIDEFTSQTRTCVKCKSTNCIEYPTCKICGSQIIAMNAKCSNIGCQSTDYANIFRTIQIKSSHEDDGEKIGFNFKLQDLVDDDRHFLVVYSRTFQDYKEKHNFWIMDVNEFRKEYVTSNASTEIYQNNRLHPPSSTSSTYFDEEKYNKIKFMIQEYDMRKNHISHKNKLEKIINKVDVFGKLNSKKSRDY